MISNIWVSDMRGMKCSRVVLSSNKCDTINEDKQNNNDRILKGHNRNKIVMHENNVDTFIFFG